MTPTQDPSSSTASPEPPRRRSRAALKELLLEAALEILRRDGVGIAATAITYQRVFDHLEATQGVRVTRGSVHERIWPSQRDFQLDVLQRAAHWDATDTNAATAAVVEEVLATADLTTPQGRWRTIQEMTRRAGPVNLDVAEERDHWSSWIGIALAVSAGRGGDAADEALLLAVADTYRELTDNLLGLAHGAQALVRARIRADLVPPDLDAERLVAMLTTALADGVALRRQLTDDLGDVELRTGPGGELETWDPFSIGMWALTNLFVELEPDDGDDLPGRSAPSL
jgi:hypothetical protein